MKESKTISTHDKIWREIATMWKFGYSPFISGTVASVLGVLAFSLFKTHFSFFIFTVFIVVIAFISSHIAEPLFGRKDPKEIIIDDFAGMLVGLLFLPHHTGLVIAAFILFRIFDAFKIYPVNKFEKYPGSLGIVGDDLMAGAYTFVCIHVLRSVLQIV